jgi:RHS repeat-associated protein
VATDAQAAPDAADALAGPEAPALTLPTGGGAIRGIGERFGVNPANGTATLSIPIGLSRGRGDFTPALDLTYDSGHGNGAFGFGWQLTQPAITRRTDRGVPTYGEEDTFLLSGADELVACAGPQERAGHRVERFRPRVEREPMRIERWTRLADGDVHWRTISKDNVLSVYGDDDSSRVSDPDDPRRVFAWLLCHSYDDKGNAMAFDYAAEDAAGVDLGALSERDRVRGAVRYLKRVRYGNRAPLLLDVSRPGCRRLHTPAPDLSVADWMFELVLDYGERHYREDEPDAQERVYAQADLEAAAGTAWAVRADPCSGYKAGFEQRTHRLCRRLLMFHHFPEELGTPDCLVRSIELTYEQTPTGAFLTGIEQRGFRRMPDGGYLRRSRPALELEYERAPLDDPDYAGGGVVELDGDSAQNLGVGSQQWVDLDGEGLSGVLSHTAGAWFYKANAGEGRLAPAQRLEVQTAPVAGIQQPLDLAGDGSVALVSLTETSPGFSPRVAGRFESFRAFASLPRVDWGSARLVDLVGDGLADLLVSGADGLRWHRSLGHEGFAEGRAIQAPSDAGLPVAPAGAAELVTFADMTGDGLADLVRVRNGDVSYWPNLGHGRFGRRVVMDDAPLLESNGRLDAARVLLADTDGSGTADLIYLDPAAVRIHLNLCGNGWSPARELRTAPAPAGATSVTVCDLLGQGSNCLVWSSDLASDARRPLRYLDLAGGAKPHLLVSVANNLGARTRVRYAPSTTFMLADKRAGVPWATRLPFPVHLVERVETLDLVARNRFVTRYSYHHGRFESQSREFRGFGRVDQVDTEELAALAATDGQPEALNVDAASYAPPVRTRIWFHTGASQTLEHEYRGAPLAAVELPSGNMPDARRALVGAPLRTEICGLDGSADQEQPQHVRQVGYAVVELEAGVFALREQTTVEIEHDRDTAENARVSERSQLAHDDVGNVLLSAVVAYGRAADAPPDPLLRAEDVARQQQTIVTYEATSFTAPVDLDDAHRAPLVAERSAFELLDVARAGDRYTPAELRDAIASSGGSASRRRPLARTQIRYRADDLASLLPLGRLESLAIPGVAHKLALTDELARTLYVDSGRVTADDLEALLAGPAGYTRLPDADGWWIPGGRIGFSADADAEPAAELAEAARGFFAGRRFADSAGAVTRIDYDAQRLLAILRVDPVGNTIGASNDYRVLAPVLTVDANGNRAEVVHDALGEVAGSAVMGKHGEMVGESLEGFVADLSPALLRAYARDPAAVGPELLGAATTRRLILYDSIPSVVATITRTAAEVPPRQEFVYNDGLGREVQVKRFEGPGRWLVDGWTIFDNKAQPVRKYEPFVDDTPAFRFAPTAGVSPIVFRDPLGQVVVTLHPHQAWDKTVSDPWRTEVWDANDTLLLDPAADATAGPYLRRLLPTAYLPTWYAARSAGALGSAEQRAATEAAAHAGTPTVQFRDALGRAFLTIAHNRTVVPGAAVAEERHRNLELLDVEGRVLRQVDACGRTCGSYAYDLLGNRLATATNDGGHRLVLLDTGGTQIRAWDARGHVFSTTRDALNRVLTRSVRGTDPERSDPRTVDRDVMYERLEYGEDLPDAAALNLRTQLVRVFDGAGVLTTDRFDFRGNCLRRENRLLADDDALADWSAEPRLEEERFVSEAEFDALNRMVRVRAPSGAVSTLAYDGGSRLATVALLLPGDPAARRFVEHVDYDARGSRTRIRYGNGTQTDYSYDPATFALVRQRTTRAQVADRFTSRLLAQPTVLQDVQHVYDAVGNLVELGDAAQRTVVAAGQALSPRVVNHYDATYRLIATSGREQGTLGDLESLRPYREQFDYDPVGNLTRVQHRAPGAGGWKREYDYSEPSALDPAQVSNRVSRAGLAAEATTPFGYDDHGNVTAMPELPSLTWDFKDQLRSSARQAGPDPEATRCAYDALGGRRRKVVTRRDGTRRSERIYLGESEVARKYAADGVTVTAERWSLHVMDDQRRIAVVDVAPGAEPAVRYQLADHLESACVDVDDTGAVVSYEQYGAWGATLVSGGRGAAEVGLKRYRFTGKERDAESGLSYHGARYYAPWLGRWLSCDPEGLAPRAPADQARKELRPPQWNLYAYARGNPCTYTDPTGRTDWVSFGMGMSLAMITIGAMTTLAASIELSGAPVPGAGDKEAHWVNIEEGGLYDLWGIGHYFAPVGITVLATIIAHALGVDDPNLMFAISGIAGSAEAFLWETVEREIFPSALEWPTNVLYEDIMQGSVAAFQWAYFAQAWLYGTKPNAGFAISFAAAWQSIQFAIGYELVYGGHIQTAASHEWDEKAKKSRRRTN